MFIPLLLCLLLLLLIGYPLLTNNCLVSTFAANENLAEHFNEWGIDILYINSHGLLITFEVNWSKIWRGWPVQLIRLLSLSSCGENWHLFLKLCIKTCFNLNMLTTLATLEDNVMLKCFSVVFKGWVIFFFPFVIEFKIVYIYVKRAIHLPFNSNQWLTSACFPVGILCNLDTGILL